MLKFILAFALLVLSACATRPTEPERGTPAPQARPKDESPVDVLGLARSLRMERPAQHLGYVEKPFNTCQVGYGYSSTHNCQRQYLVAVNFRLQCRDTSGTATETVTADQIRPVTSDQVRWNLGPHEGYTATDGDGFGQIRAIVPASSRKQRLRLTVAGKFLVLRAEEITRIVAPDDWCRGL